MTQMQKVLWSQNLLKWSVGIVLILIGLDQLFRTDLIHAWPAYVSPLAHMLLPLSDDLIIRVLGAAEIVVGILMLTKLTKIAAYIAGIVLVVTAVNLVDLGLLDVAVRDLLLAGGMLVLAWLTDVVHGNVPMVVQTQTTTTTTASAV